MLIRERLHLFLIPFPVKISEDLGTALSFFLKGQIIYFFNPLHLLATDVHSTHGLHLHIKGRVRSFGSEASCGNGDFLFFLIVSFLKKTSFILLNMCYSYEHKTISFKIKCLK